MGISPRAGDPGLIVRGEYVEPLPGRIHQNLPDVSHLARMHRPLGCAGSAWCKELATLVHPTSNGNRASPTMTFRLFGVVRLSGRRCGCNFLVPS